MVGYVISTAGRNLFFAVYIPGKISRFASCPVQTANNRTYLYCFERPLGKRALRIFDSLSGNMIEETAPFPQTFATLIYPDGKGFVYMTTNDFKGRGGIHAFAAAGR